MRSKAERAMLFGAAWSLCGAALTRAGLLGASVASGRLLGVVDFGKLGMVQSTTALFGALAGSGLGLAATAVIARTREEDAALAGGVLVRAQRLALWFGAAGAIFVFAVGPLAQLRPELRVAAPLVLFGALNVVQSSALAGLGAFRALALASLVRGVMSLLCIAVGARVGGLRGAIAGQLGAELLSAAAFHAAVVSAARTARVPLGSPAPLQGVRLLRGLALPTVLGTLALQLAFWLSNVLLAAGPSGFSEVGLFSAADQWKQVLLFVPALSQIDGAGDRGGSGRGLGKSLGITLVVVAIPACVAMLLSPVCLSLFGAEYHRGARAMAILAACSVPMALNKSLGQVLIARGRVWWRFFVDVLLAAALMGTAATLVPTWGAAGLAAAHGLAFVLATAALAVALPYSPRERPPVEHGQPLLLHVTTVPQTLRFLTGQIGYMKSAGHTVGAISSDSRELLRFGAGQGIQTWSAPLSRRISPLLDLAALVRLIWLFIRLRPTVVHAHTPKAGLLGMLASAVTAVPVRIYHLHGLPAQTARGLKRWLLVASDRVAVALAHRVLAVSPSLLAAATAQGLVDKDKATVPAGGSINGVDAQVAFSPQMHRKAGAHVRSRLWLPKDALVVGFVGRICRDKGVVELCEAWRAVREKFASAHLIVVGPLDDTDPVPDSTLWALRSDPSVHLAGLDWDVAPYLAAMDLLVLPTHREGLGTVLLEAGAMGLPVVATKTTGCVDAVVDGRTGLLVSAKDPASLARAIGAYLDSQVLRATHGAAAREHILTRFAQPVVWRAMAGEYERALAQRGGGRVVPTSVQVAPPA